MKERAPTIPKTPALSPAADFAALWAAGLAAIEALGSQDWTDYNAHDPGITLMEAMAYAISDLAYRTGWDIKDLLAGVTDQPFFTAAAILTGKPVTLTDYRCFLIDLEGVRNAWLAPSACHCDLGLIPVRGLYDLHLELDGDDALGDLNDRTVEAKFNVTGTEGATHELLIEVRFPAWGLVARRQFAEFMALTPPFTVRCTRFMRTPAAASTGVVIITDEELRRYWRGVFYATIELEVAGSALEIVDISLRLFSTAAGKAAASVAAVIEALCVGQVGGILAFYREKELRAAAIVEAARRHYAAHRNLDEDVYCVAPIRVEPVAICADLDAAPDADLEQIQAEVWFAIENYLSPAVPFHSLAELLADGMAVERIFEGPKLANGFIQQCDLEAAGICSEVRASDLINLIMDIEGVLSVNGLLMTSYDDAGELKVTEPWLLPITTGRQPRLYRRLSTFRFAQRGLPLSVDEDEACAVLSQLRGAADRPPQGTTQDLPVPVGAARNVAAITPLQYALPQTYGVGPAGLPSHVGDERRAQAKQLKAYLQVFEQILGDAFEQLAHLGELFSLDRNVKQTYFPHVFSEEALQGYTEVTGGTGIDASALFALLETSTGYQARRNGFLDHIMARFGEDFNDYALLLRNWQGERLANARLIDDKISFLKAYPELSGARSRAFNHRQGVLLLDNQAVLKRRLGFLLGFPDLAFYWEMDTSDPSQPKVIAFTLAADGQGWLTGAAEFAAITEEAAKHAAARAILHALCRRTAYSLRADAAGYHLVLSDPALGALGEAPVVFSTVDAAEVHAEELRAWASYARSCVVEHLLLRPKFPGDARYRECVQCDESDPWSFRITMVMPGWAPPYSTNLDLRGFADRTIREELPSHLLAKICWVGNDGYEADPCDPVVDELTRLLEANAADASGARPDCETARNCAIALYQHHVDHFAEWFMDNRLRSFDRADLAEILRPILAAATPAAIDCPLALTAVWERIQVLLLARFVDVAQLGWQFERFEAAWYDWVTEDAKFDWGVEALAARLEALLRQNLVSGDSSLLCDCAQAILDGCGRRFRDWMDANLALGRTFEEFGPFLSPAIQPCAGLEFKPDTAARVQLFLSEAYGRYAPVSYRLTLLVRCLETLASSYPAATLHDCKGGGASNRVRLGQTNLGALTLSGGEDIELTPPEP